MSSSLGQLFQEAVALHRQGRLTDAENLYVRIVEAQPDHFDALHHLGIAKAQRGDNQQAEKLIATALRLRPNSAEALASFANVLSAAKRHDEALATYQRALTVNPRDVGESCALLATVIGEAEASAATIDRCVHSPANQPKQQNHQDRP